MSTIIKKGGKFYRQEIREDEVHLDSLEENLVDIRARKTKNTAEQRQDFDNQITEIQDEIDQIKTL